MQPETMEPAQPVKSAENEFLRELVSMIGQRKFDHWFDQKSRFLIEGDELSIEVPNLFLLNWLQRKFRPPLQECANRILGPSARLRFLVTDSLSLANSSSETVRFPNGVSATENGQAPLKSEVSQSSNSRTSRVASLSRPLQEVPETLESNFGSLSFKTLMDGPSPEPRSSTPQSRISEPFPNRTVDLGQPLNVKTRRYASLEDFQEGPGSMLALTAAREVCQRPGAQFSPLYLHGGVGLGKTHLLEGIAKELRQRFPSLQIVHMTAENFTNYFTVALRQHSLPSFRQKFRTADVLLLDDVDFLDSKRGIQEELLHTLKHLEAHGRQIVLTADRHPRLLTRTSDELKTRFLSGMVCRLEPPCQETRRKILDRKAAKLSGEFSPEALNYISQRFRNSVRELEGALRTLQTYHCMTGKRVGITAARQLLADLERDCIKVVKLSDIERIVCDLFGLMQEELRSAKRIRSVSQPRMLAMFLARKHTRAAYSEIGAYFGGRNHSTVITAEKKISALLKSRYEMRVATQQWSVEDVIENIEQQLSQAG